MTRKSAWRLRHCPARRGFPNLARYDASVLAKTALFGLEAKRRIITGTFVLSAGYFDQYYLRAQKVRTKISQNFAQAFEEVDLILAPTSPSAAIEKGGQEKEPLLAKNRILVEASSLAGLPGISLNAGFTKRACRWERKLSARPKARKNPKFCLLFGKNIKLKMKRKLSQTVFANRSFLELWGVQIASVVSANILLFSSINFIFNHTQSTIAVGLLTFFYYLPTVILGFFSGAVVDRFPKDKILVISTLAQALFIWLFLGIKTHPFLIYPLVFLYSSFDEFINPTIGALLPETVKKEHLGEANSVWLFLAGAVILGQSAPVCF